MAFQVDSFQNDFIQLETGFTPFVVIGGITFTYNSYSTSVQWISIDGQIYE